MNFKHGEHKYYVVNLVANSDYDFYNCTFEENTASIGSAIMFKPPNNPDVLSQLIFSLLELKIEQSVFLQNIQTIPENDGGGSSYSVS